MSQLWRIEWMAVTKDGRREVPGFLFLVDLPLAPQRQLLAILDSVVQVGVEQWKDMDMHCPMHGACAHLHEVRDRHGEDLYRLYVYWQRDKRRVVVITGGEKPNGTALPAQFYEELGRLSEVLDDDETNAIASPDDISRLALELARRVAEAEERAKMAERDVDELLGR